MTAITANMRIRDLLQQHPRALQVLRGYGISCGDCHAGRYESVGQGARVHNIDLQGLLADLNRAVANPPAGPRTLPLPLLPADRLAPTK